MKTLDFDKDNTIIKLTKLHKQALKFIEEMKSGCGERTISKEELEEFAKLTSQLEEYIEDIKDGTNPYTTYEEWCTLLGDIILDDDNFVIDEEGFLW